MDTRANLRPTAEYQAMDAAHHWHPFSDSADLARRGGMTPRTVERAIASLIGRGLLKRVRRGSLWTGPSTYRVLGLSSDPLPDTGDG